MATKSVIAPTTAPQVTNFATQSRGERHRLFFALVPNAGTRLRIARAAEQLNSHFHPRGHWTAAERYHITLHFLGDYPELRPDDVGRASAAAAKIVMPAFDLLFDSASSFHGHTPPWVLRCPEPAEPIRKLWHALEIALVAEKFRTESDRTYTPHITVLRDADKPLQSTPITPIDWPVRDFVLMHSQLGRERKYTELARWPLANDKRPSS